MPTSLLLTWAEITHKLRSDNEFKERVDMARKHMNEFGRGFHDSFPETVKTSEDLAMSGPCALTQRFTLRQPAFQTLPAEPQGVQHEIEHAFQVLQSSVLGQHRTGTHLDVPMKLDFRHN